MARGGLNLHSIDNDQSKRSNIILLNQSTNSRKAAEDKQQAYLLLLLLLLLLLFMLIFFCHDSILTALDCVQEIMITSEMQGMYLGNCYRHNDCIFMIYIILNVIQYLILTSSFSVIMYIFSKLNKITFIIPKIYIIIMAAQTSGCPEQKN